MEPMTDTTGLRHLAATRMHPNDSSKGVRPYGPTIWRSCPKGSGRSPKSRARSALTTVGQHVTWSTTVLDGRDRVTMSLFVHLDRVNLDLDAV